MKYTKKEAKEYAFKFMKGIWAAALNPFLEDHSFDERGFRSNLRHWIDDLGIDGFLFQESKVSFFRCQLKKERKVF